MNCCFCDRSGDIPNRILFDSPDMGWFAFLSAPPHTKGHAILARRKEHHCPRGLEQHTLQRLDVALSTVAQVLRRQYPVTKEILLASLRGDVQHFHVHLLPLWPAEEDKWRQVTGYTTSHLLEFLGSLEQRHDFVLVQRQAQGKDIETQRSESTSELQIEIIELRRITGYRI